MRAFLKKVFGLYFLPVFIYFLIVYLLDPLKCFRSYGEYYANNFVSPNRENVCINLFERNDSNHFINSYILGNSISHAYKTGFWLKYLPSGSIAFHLDAYRETLYGIQKKLEYLDTRGNALNNALVIIDRSTFSSKFKSYMYVMPKKLDHTNQFYIESLKALTSIKFMVSYCYYYLFHKNLSFMQEYGFTDRHHVSNNKTGDLNYFLDKEIAEDSTKYFLNLKKQDWIDRQNVINLIGNSSFEGLNKRNIKCLKSIKEIFSKKNTNYKIIISPLYDQKKIPAGELVILQNIFGANNVYDFSGVNYFTEDVKNYYDGIHYRPVVANKIMDSIYTAINFKDN